MASFVKRPSIEETEEDILRQQEEFMQSDLTPSARVVRMMRRPDKRKSKLVAGRDSVDDSLRCVTEGSHCEIETC